jgi:tetratricopeptide (TPR) repeat protein
MKKLAFYKPLFMIFLLIFWVQSAHAQAGRGKARLGGVVIDEAGNPINGAKIVLEFLATERENMETATNNKGAWGVIGLGTGKVRVTATAKGFLATSQEVNVQQLSLNPQIKMTLKIVPKSEAPAIDDEASLVLFDKGNQLFAEKNYDEAIIAFEQFLEKNPNAFQIHLSLGDCYREKGQFEKAIEEYNKVTELSGKDVVTGKELSAKSLAAIGECYLKMEDFEKAQTYFKQSVDAYAENEILAYNVGEIYFSNQKIDEAIQYYELAIKIKPGWGTPYLRLGYAYLNKGTYAKAIQNFEKYLEIEPESSEAPKVKSLLEQLKKMNGSFFF